MDKLVQWLQKIRTKAETFLGVVIGLIAVVFVGLKIIKTIQQIKESNWSKVLLSIAEILAIILVAGMGIYGFHKLFDMVKPDQDLIPN